MNLTKKMMKLILVICKTIVEELSGTHPVIPVDVPDITRSTMGDLFCGAVKLLEDIENPESIILYNTTSFLIQGHQSRRKRRFDYEVRRKEESCRRWGLISPGNYGYIYAPTRLELSLCRETELSLCRTWSWLVIVDYHKNKSYRWNYNAYNKHTGQHERSCYDVSVFDTLCTQSSSIEKVWVLQEPLDVRRNSSVLRMRPQISPLKFQRMMSWMFSMFYKANYWSDEPQTYIEEMFLCHNSFHIDRHFSRYQKIHILRLVKQCFDTTIKLCTESNRHLVNSLDPLNLKDSLNATYEWSIDTPKFNLKVFFSMNNHLVIKMKWKNIHDWVNIISPKRSCTAYLIGTRRLSKDASTGFPMIFGENGRLNDATNKLIYAYLKR